MYFLFKSCWSSRKESVCLVIYLNFFSASVWLVILPINAVPRYAMLGGKIQMLLLRAEFRRAHQRKFKLNFLHCTVMLSASVGVGVIKLNRKYVKAFCSLCGDSNGPSISFPLI